MRTITAAQQAVLDSGVQSEHARLWVKDVDGTWRDVTTYPGFNALRSVSWKGAISDPHASFDATITRESFDLSLAPMMEDSALNRKFDPAEDYAPLLQIGREVKIEVAIVGFELEPESGDWMELFLGRIDRVNSAADDAVTIEGRSKSGRLAQQYVKRERVYSFIAVSGAVKSARIWSPEMIVISGEYLIPATRGDDDSGFDKFFVAASAGTTGLTEPTWSTGSGIADGDLAWDYVGAPDTGGFPVEDVMQNILDDNIGIGDSAVTLNTPSSPLWDITQYMQGRGFTWDAIAALAGQIGWDLRDLFDEGSGTWKLTFYEPDRDVTDEMYSFGPGDHGKLQEVSVDIIDIRNSGVVIIMDVSNPWPDGTPKRIELVATDPDSIDKYQELWGEIQEDETGNIDTEVEGNRLLSAFISDCSEPDVVLRVPLARGFPWAVVNDFYKFKANGLQYSTDKKLAVTDISQSFESGKLTTELGVRGKPTSGTRVHLEKTAHPNKPAKQTVHRLEHFQGVKTPSLAFEPTVGGVKIKLNLDVDKGALLEEYEIHIYSDPLTPLDDTTLAYVGSLRNIELGDLIGGTDYYAVVVPRFHNAGKLVRGQPSKEKLFTAGRANAGHLAQGIEWGRMPLNGGFETWNDTSTVPDHWNTFQTWGVNFERVTGSDGVSGDSWLRFNTQLLGVANIFTDNFTVERGASYDVGWWANIFDAASAGGVKLCVNWFDYAGSLISTDDVDQVLHNEAGMDPGTWYLRKGVVTAPDDARFACIILKQIVGDMSLDIDSVRFERA